MKKKILVVEDCRIIAEDVTFMIKQLNYQVTDVVSSKKDAFISIREKQPDLILMDINIDSVNQKINGIELADQINQEFNIPVIFMSADVTEKTFINALDKLPYGFIQKPIDDFYFKSIIKTALKLFDFHFNKNIISGKVQ